VADALTWLEASALGHTMRTSGVWTYGLVNLTHILGVASLFGAVLVLDLRLLGAWRRVSLASIARPTVPVATTGFLVAATSGVCLIATNATEYIGNPFLLVKFPAIAIGLLNVAVLGRLPAWRARETRELTPREQRQLAVAGGVSLISWLTAVAAGRLTGYW
jgi:hypothetical protein